MDASFMPEEGIAGNYISTSFSPEGNISAIQFHNDEHFNFAFDIMDQLAEKCPDKTAMLHISKDGKERRFTFLDMMLYSNRAANYFSYIGIKKGDRVMLVLKRHYQFWFCMLALNKIGAIAIPATYLLTRKDFEYRFRAGKIDAVIATTDGEVISEINKSLKGYEGLKAKIAVGGSRTGWKSFNQELRYFSSHFRRPVHSAGGDDPMLMYFTSGTTSYPKMALHNCKYPLGHFITAKYWHQVDPNGLHLTISDTGWAKAAWGKIYGQWLCEAPIFVYDYDEFFAKEILGMVEKYKITTFCAPPTVYRMLVHADMSKYDLSSLQHASTAGEALNTEVFRKFQNATGLSIMEGFGQSETTMIIGCLKGTEPHPGSMGKANPLYDVHVLRPDGTPCEPKEVGEICIRTDINKPIGLFMGYYMDPDKTASVWHDGFYHTGDTACCDELGYYWYVGRVDDVIKSAGYRVGPFEIENEIMKLPYVLECAVTSVPDKIRGQAIKASIVLVSGTQATDQLKKDVMKYMRSALASYKRPKYVEFVPELPKTTSGKIRRIQIRES